MKKLKEVFTVEKDGKTLEIAIKRPSAQIQTQADQVYHSKVYELCNPPGGKPSAMLRYRAEQILKEMGIWGDKQEKQADKIEKAITRLEKKLIGGKIRLIEARKIALDILRKRRELRELVSAKNALDGNTIEAQADNARFNYLLVNCMVYNDTDEPYYSSMEEYIESPDEVALLGVSKLAEMLYGYNTDSLGRLPENKFLKQYGFVDDKYRLINEDGHLIDEDGRFIDENGRYIDEEGNFVNRSGNLVDDNGDEIINFGPFLDDKDNEIT